MMILPPAWEILSEQLWHLSQHQRKQLWFGIQEARWTRAVRMRQHLALVGPVRLDLTHLYQTLLSPPAVMATIEDLVRERCLRRVQAAHIQQTMLENINDKGGWRGDAWAAPLRNSTFPPDVLRFADVGTL